MPSRDPWIPNMARLSASVPPAVKMISFGSQPKPCESVSRASSMSRLASLAILCAPDGLP